MLREEYWIIKVQISRRDMTGLRDQVNKYLETDNGTNYIYYDNGKGSIKEKFNKIIKIIKKIKLIKLIKLIIKTKQDKIQP
mgnify:CR=1 FL=1